MPQARDDDIPGDPNLLCGQRRLEVHVCDIERRRQSERFVDRDVTVAGFGSRDVRRGIGSPMSANRCESSCFQRPDHRAAMNFNPKSNEAPYFPVA
jgi:hypothetical protein